MRPSPRVVEALAMAVVAAVAFAGARASFLETIPAPHFYQAAFGPAVMVAAGQGFVNPVPAPESAFAAFLATSDVSMEASDAFGAEVGPPDAFQEAHRYLLLTVGVWWRIAGISWDRLAEIAGASHALASVAAWALLRVFVPAGAAVAGALWFALSPLQVSFAPHLRDFVKAPFMLAALAGIVALVTRPTLAGAWRLAAGLGAAIGIGLGFRMDVMIMLPLAVVAVVVFGGGRPWLALRDKGVVVAAIVLAAAVTAWPVWSRLSSGGSNSYHVVLLGYSDWFDTRLGIAPASYSYLPFYSDDHLRHLLRARASAESGTDVEMPSVAYNAAAFDLWREWVRHFPADAYTRLLAAADGVLNLGFDYPRTPGSVRAWGAARIMDALNRAHGWGWLLGAGAVMAAARAGAGRAMFAAFLLLAIAGYPSLQFDPRHYFHLQAVPIVIMVALGWHGVRLGMAATRSRWGRASRVALVRWPRPGAVATAFLVPALVVVPVPALRAYQTQHLIDVVATFLDEARTPMPVSFETLENGRVRAHWPMVEGRSTTLPGVRAAYYMAEFRADEAASAMAVGLRFAEAPGWEPCAVTRAIVTGPGVVRFGFPVTSVDGVFRFDGLELGPEMQRRLVGVSRVATGPAGLPMGWHLAADWEARHMTQRLVKEERLAADDTSPGVFATRDRCGLRLPFIDATLDTRLAVDGQVVTFADPNMVRVADGALVVSGTPEASGHVFARFASQTFGAGDVFVARVHVGRGGLIVGLQREGVWVAETIVPRPGLNVITVPAPERGAFTPVVANGAPGWRHTVEARLDRAGVVAADGTAVPLGARR